MMKTYSMDMKWKTKCMKLNSTQVWHVSSSCSKVNGLCLTDSCRNHQTQPVDSRVWDDMWQHRHNNLVLTPLPWLFSCKVHSKKSLPLCLKCLRFLYSTIVTPVVLRIRISAVETEICLFFQCFIYSFWHLVPPLPIMQLNCYVAEVTSEVRGTGGLILSLVFNCTPLFHFKDARFKWDYLRNHISFQRHKNFSCNFLSGPQNRGQPFRKST